MSDVGGIQSPSSLTSISFDDVTTDKLPKPDKLKNIFPAELPGGGAPAKPDFNAFMNDFAPGAVMQKVDDKVSEVKVSLTSLIESKAGEAGEAAARHAMHNTFGENVFGNLAGDIAAPFGGAIGEHAMEGMLEGEDIPVAIAKGLAGDAVSGGGDLAVDVVTSGGPTGVVGKKVFDSIF